MTNNRHEEATRLANRSYRTLVFLDETTEGEPIYVALNPELKGCVSQGDTPDEAVTNLREARFDFIYFLLEDGLDVPEPQQLGSHVAILMSENLADNSETSRMIYEMNPDYPPAQSA